MSDLISRQAAIEVIDAVFPVNPMKSEYAQGIACGAALAKTYVEALPSVQTRKGKWIGKEKYMNSPEYFSWQCSVCGCVLEDPTLDKPYPFCPNCGADMREGEE